VWQRRQKISPQQVTTGPALIEGVKRMNVVMKHPQQREGIAQRNHYAMDIDRGRNCYTCRGFGHMAQYCRNKGTGGRIGQGRRLEYGNESNRQRRTEGGNEQQDNLNGEQDLILLN